MRWLNSITDSMDMSLSKLQKMVKDSEAWHAAVHGSQRVGWNRVTERRQQYNFIFLNSTVFLYYFEIFYFHPMLHFCRYSH